MNGESVILTRWKQLSAGSLNRRIFSAAVLVGVLTLSTKIVAMAKEMFVAAAFGTGDAMDAFLVAILLPSYAINVLAGQMNAALIPVFVEVREKEGAAQAQRLFSGALVFSIALLAGATLLLGLAAPLVLPLLCSGFAPAKLQLTIQLFYLLLPLIVLTGLVMNCEAALNAGEKFALAALAPAVVPLATVAAAWALAARWGVHALVLGVVAGTLLQLGLVIAALRRRGVGFTPRWRGLEPGIRRMIAQYFPAAAASAMMCSTQLIDQSMASMLAPGSVASLNYGNKLVALALTIGTMALGTAVLPFFSKMVAASDWTGLRHTLKTYLRLILLVTIPLVAAGMLLSRPLVALLFERGSFTAADTARVAGIQSMLLLQIPFYTLTILFVRMISSLQANKVLMWGTAISFVVNISLNYILMQFMGVAGIALSTSIVYAVLCVFLGTVLFGKLRAIAKPAAP